MTSLVTRRRVLQGAVSVPAAMAFSDALRAQSTNFVFGTFGGPYEKILRQHIIADFDRANNVQTKLEFGLGTTFIQRLIAARTRSPYDVIIVNEDEALVGAEANLFAPLMVDKIPNASQIHDALMPPKVQMYGTMLFELTCVYNSKTMPKPQSWSDLWKPGVRVAVPHPQNSYGLLFLQIAAELAGSSDSKLADGFAMLKKLDKPKLYRGVVDGIQLFRTGEADAGLFYRNRAIQLADEGFPIAFEKLKEGSFGVRSGQQIPRAAPNIDLSLKWLNLALSADYQRHFVEGLYSPSNRTIELPPQEAARHIYGAEAINALRFADWQKINQQKPEIYERWDREFAM
jgi:putative spermidine/putrescine transport system substrate-binding protein